MNSSDSLPIEVIQNLRHFGAFALPNVSAIDDIPSPFVLHPVSYSRPLSLCHPFTLFLQSLSRISTYQATYDRPHAEFNTTQSKESKAEHPKNPLIDDNRPIITPFYSPSVLRLPVQKKLRYIAKTAQSTHTCREYGGMAFYTPHSFLLPPPVFHTLTNTLIFLPYILNLHTSNPTPAFHGPICSTLNKHHHMHHKKPVNDNKSPFLPLLPLLAFSFFSSHILTQIPRSRGTLLMGDKCFCSRKCLADPHSTSDAMRNPVEIRPYAAVLSSDTSHRFNDSEESTDGLREFLLPCHPPMPKVSSAIKPSDGYKDIYC